jgi:hypothetical protein
MSGQKRKRPVIEDSDDEKEVVRNHGGPTV